MEKQKTIKKSVSLRGTEITGETGAQVTFYPAPPDTGIIFIRKDLPGGPQVKSLFNNAQVEYRWTSLILGNVRIEHTEHALAAISGLDLDNLFIELNQPSLPVTPDYSSKYFARDLLSAGIEEQPIPKEKIIIRKPIMIFNRERLASGINEKMIMALPSDGFKLTYVLDYPGLPQLTQSHEISLTPQTFMQELAGARSFIIESETDEVMELTGKVSAQVLVINSGPKEGEWLWPNEPARHKTLDLLGDLSLLGKKIQGHVIGIRSGHRLNLELCKKIYQEC